tara:strand:- start:113 stop:604 length:492 start_codon:yes stop_codon:yes gene_type:complete
MAQRKTATGNKQGVSKLTVSDKNVPIILGLTEVNYSAGSCKVIGNFKTKYNFVYEVRDCGWAGGSKVKIGTKQYRARKQADCGHHKSPTTYGDRDRKIVQSVLKQETELMDKYHKATKVDKTPTKEIVGEAKAYTKMTKAELLEVIASKDAVINTIGDAVKNQ